MYLVRQLLDLLRNGHRRAGLRPERAGYRAFIVRGLWHLLVRLPARGSKSGKRPGEFAEDLREAGYVQ